MLPVRSQGMFACGTMRIRFDITVVVTTILRWSAGSKRVGVLGTIAAIPDRSGRLKQVGPLRSSAAPVSFPRPGYPAIRWTHPLVGRPGRSVLQIHRARRTTGLAEQPCSHSGRMPVVKA